MALKLDAGRESLAKSPICWNNTSEKSSYTIGGGDLEGQRLTIQILVGLPIFSPVSCHGHPSSFWAFDIHRFDRSSSSHIGDQYKLKVVVPIHSEPNSSLPRAWNPASKTTLIHLPPTKNAHLIFMSISNWENHSNTFPVLYL